jgi:hypothetical protein
MTSRRKTMNKATLPLLICLGLSSVSAVAQDGVETSFDGLQRIDKGEFKLTYADPDVDFSVYSKYVPGPATFEFRAVKKTSTAQARRSNTNEYYISDRNRAKLEEVVTGIFADELSKSEIFTETTDPGPDTLIIRGALHDIVSRVPPELVGRGEIYLASVGEATLIIEALDSLSGEVIYRGIERRAIQRGGNQMVLSNTATNWGEVRRWARCWATRLREAMDSIHE